MTVDALAALERALDVGDRRPCLAPDVELARFASRFQGRHAVIRNPRTSTYLRLTGQEAHLVEALDGTRSLAELTVDQLDTEGLDPDAVAQVVHLLHRRGYLTEPWVDAYAVLAARLSPVPTRALGRISAAMSSATLRFPGAPAFLHGAYSRVGRAVFSRPFRLASVLVLVAGIAAFLARRDDPGNSLLGRPTAGVAATLWLLGLVALFVHELGHALAIRHADRDVLGAGFQIYLANPVFFIDSSDMVMATPRQRAVNAIAGPYAEGVVASLASLGSLAAGDTSLGRLLFRFAGVTYVFTLFNAIPFLELDGYWLLTDLLDLPDLRPRSLAFLRHELPGRLRSRTRLSRAEWGLTLFGVLGALSTVGFLALGAVFWWPLASGFGSGLWDAGLGGRVFLVLLVLLVLGPVAHGVGGLARPLSRWAGNAVAALRFRLEGRWRVEAAELIAALPLVVSLTDEELGDLAGRVRRRRVDRGQLVVRQGAPADAFYVLRRGTCAVVEQRQDGSEAVLAHLAPGASFGELALLEGTARVVSVRAETAAEVFVIDAGTFHRVLSASLAPQSLEPAEWPLLQVWRLAPFRGLDLAAVTSLVAAGRWQRVAAGTDVVQQGEPGEAFFVVGSGQLEVVRDGERVDELGRGDHFGELALLNDAPRNATVRTTSTARLFVLEREAFDGLVRGSFARHPDADVRPPALTHDKSPAGHS